MIKVIKAIDKGLEAILRYALIITVAAMILLTAWQVLCRYVLLISVAYAEELARLSIVWCIYLGAALGVRHAEHINVTLLTDVLPHWMKAILQVLSYLLVILFAGVLCIYGYRHVLTMRNDVTTSLGYHRYWFFVPNIIGGFLIVAYSIADIIIYLSNYFKGRKELREGKKE